VTLAVRIGLVAVAAAAVAWLGLGLRASRLEARGIALAKAKPDLSASLKTLKDAEANNADSQPVLLQGELLLFAGQPGRAITPLMEVVRREPDNFEAWRLLAQAAASTGNRVLQASAQRRAVALSPPVPRR
jgi:predicted Zn-dependent protease